MEMARRFPEQENVGGCRYFGGWPVAKAGTQGRAANATKRGARETKAHGGLRVFLGRLAPRNGANLGPGTPGKISVVGDASTSIAVARTRLIRQIGAAIRSGTEIRSLYIEKGCT
jgi:hypothetical protein